MIQKFCPKPLHPAMIDRSPPKPLPEGAKPTFAYHAFVAFKKQYAMPGQFLFDKPCNKKRYGDAFKKTRLKPKNITLFSFDKDKSFYDSFVNFKKQASEKSYGFFSQCLSSITGLTASFRNRFK